MVNPLADPNAEIDYNQKGNDVAAKKPAQPGSPAAPASAKKKKAVPVQKNLDRESLIDTFGIKLPMETPEERKRSIRYLVDKKLTRMFGGWRFLDWSYGKTYTLDQIAERLSNADINVSPQSFVKERLHANRYDDDYFHFKEIIDHDGHKFYRLDFCKESSWGM